MTIATVIVTKNTTKQRWTKLRYFLSDNHKRRYGMKLHGGLYAMELEDTSLKSLSKEHASLSLSLSLKNSICKTLTFKPF